MKKPLYSNTYTHYVLGVLVVVYVFNFIDRQILAILAPAIRDELLLSDTQIGALSGVAFGIFYATLGIPIARLADRYSRVSIISICLSIWSLMTAFSGLATNFIQLLIARIGVGIGEAGGSPPSHSLLADYFAPGKRATALGIYALGIPVGILFGNLAGGWIGEIFGWRQAFFLVGIPGIILAIILKLTVKEPPRGYSEEKPADTSTVPFRTVLKTMWGYKSFKYISLGAGTQAFVGYGAIAWMPSFLVRAHDLSIGEVGTALGLIIGFFGGIGTLLSGVIGDKLGAKNVKYYMLVPAYGFLIAVPAGAAVFLVDELYLVLAIYTIPVFLINLYTGPTFAMTQSLAPLAMRAAASALLLFIINIIGLVFGPTTVGIISDLLQSSMQMNDVESLQMALLACNFVYLFSFYYYFQASRHLETDLNSGKQ
ncbi:MAG: MFS transporter [bacterium]|nr:MFS transporter [Gammaproteobacteria bacterium]HIL84850.1 MFS transporter [Pseudomonadales bacterium]